MYGKDICENISKHRVLAKSWSKTKLIGRMPGAARVGVWVLRWTHTFYLDDQNFGI